MRNQHFTINVPNPTAKPVTAELRLKRMADSALQALGIDIPKGSLDVLSASLSLDPCDGEGKERMTIKLRPFSSLNVTARIVTGPARGRKGGAAAFHLVDTRLGKVGGVLLVCTDRMGPEAPGSVVGIKNGCPVTLARAPYAVAPAADPSKRVYSAVPGALVVDLVVPVTNPTRSTLHDVQVYLEHLGGCDAQFYPATWNVGTLDRGDVF